MFVGVDMYVAYCMCNPIEVHCMCSPLLTRDCIPLNGPVLGTRNKTGICFPVFCENRKTFSPSAKADTCAFSYCNSLPFATQHLFVRWLTGYRRLPVPNYPWTEASIFVTSYSGKIYLFSSPQEITVLDVALISSTTQTRTQLSNIDVGSSCNHTI